MSALRSLRYDEVECGFVLPTLNVDVSATDIVLGAVASRDWRPMHHDQKFAVERNGVEDIFLNTPTQAGWLEHYVTAWTGPGARLGTMKFAMKKSIFPETSVVFSGEVIDKRIQNNIIGWLALSVLVTSESGTATEAAINVALPLHSDTNLWALEKDQWMPGYYQRG